MWQQILRCTAMLTFLLVLTGCSEQREAPKLGISFGVGEAARWPKELKHMTARAESLGMQVEARLNKTDKPKTQAQDCFEMIDSGISVLIIVARDAHRVEEILNYAARRNVSVIAYARAIMNDNVNLFVGYDSYRIGYTLGQHLTEKVYQGDFIILKGDANDFNTPLLYYGAMKSIQPLIDNGNIRVILDDYVKNWSFKAAQEMVKKAVADNNNKVDAIFAPNDLLAEASAIALEELGVTTKVLISGMDAELPALKRIVAGTQEVSMFMDIQEMAHTAVDEAYNMATKKKVHINSQLDNSNSTGRGKIDAFLINGRLITKENIDTSMIEAGHVAKEALYPNATAPAL